MLRHLLSLGAVAAFAAPTLYTPSAQACGGFFCSQIPVDQTGEQIVFAVGEDTVSATIQIAYQGEAEDFAWVIPVNTAPQIEVAPQDLFTQLRWRTDPQFRLNRTSSGGTCHEYAYPPMAFDSAAGGGNGVEVVDQSDVGPYNTVTLDSNDSQALFTWLNENGFDQPPESLPLIDHYVKNDMFFVALKLKKGASTGEIQPVKLTFQEENPCVPLILTQIAASNDMPVRIWVLGQHRAVPLNWFHVELNLKKINWFADIYGGFGGFGGPFGGSMGVDNNYDAVLTQAVNEAAGHAFHTEFAGPTADMGLENALYDPNRFDLGTLQTLTDPAAFVSEALSQGFPRDATMQALLRKHIPMPQALIDQGLEERDFYNNLEGYAEYFPAMNFDPVAFAMDLDERIIQPMEDAQNMVLEHPYLTRLYSTVSPDEMTRDPLFGFNPDLPDVSNIHEADAEYICAPADGTQTDKVIITLANGDQFEVEGPFDDMGQPVELPDFPTEPAASKIELLGTSGEGKIVLPGNAASVDQQLDVENPENVLGGLVTPEITPPMTGGGDGTSGVSGCNSGGNGESLPVFALLAILALALVRRRA